jgi:hypothetical protein
MSLLESTIINSLKTKLPEDVLIELVKEFKQIKLHFMLMKWRPSELNCARFGECVLRLLQHINGDPITPFGTTANSEKIISRIENNTIIDDGVRFLIPRLVRVVLDFRNKRDVAHVATVVDPNEADSLLVLTSSSWIFAEIIRNYHSVSIDEATKIVRSIVETNLPIVNDFDGFVRILDTSLTATEKTLVSLYYKQPEKVKDTDLFKWTEYGIIGNYKSKILKPLHQNALVHYENSFCALTTKGISDAEKIVSRFRL